MLIYWIKIQNYGKLYVNCCCFFRPKRSFKISLSRMFKNRFVQQDQFKFATSPHCTFPLQHKSPEQTKVKSEKILERGLRVIYQKHTVLKMGVFLSRDGHCRANNKRTLWQKKSHRQRESTFFVSNEHARYFPWMEKWREWESAECNYCDSFDGLCSRKEESFCLLLCRFEGRKFRGEWGWLLKVVSS